MDREQLESTLAELREGRLKARKDARSGNPAKRAQGTEAVAALTKWISDTNARLCKGREESGREDRLD